VAASFFKHAKRRLSAAQSVELQRLGIENLPGQDSARVVHLNPVEAATPRKFGSNAVHTAK